jgi:hypothetical protein
MEPSVTDMSPAVALTYLDRLREKDQFAIFELPAQNLFVQVMREESGGLHIEVSRSTPQLEALVGSLGVIGHVEGFGFPSTMTLPGHDERVAEMIAQALVVLAAQGGCPNETRVTTG